MKDICKTPPRLIVVGGFAGAGKSTLARRLSNAMSVPVFEIDSIGRTIRNSENYHGTSREAQGIAFDFFYSFAKQCLQNRVSLILDQNMGHPITWQNVAKLGDQVGDVEVKILILNCPYEVCVHRFRQRDEHPHLNEVNIHEHRYKWDYLNDNKFDGALRIDATKSEEEVFKEAISFLSQ